MLPPSFVPLWRALVHAMTQPTGKPRCLTSDRLFKVGFGAAAADASRALQVHEHKRCWVAIADPRIIRPTLEMSDRHAWSVNVSITCWYPAGHELNPRETSSAYEVALEDVEYVRAALCYPGALQLDPEGNETGLDSDSLSDALTVSGPVLLRPPDRFIRVVYAWTTTLELAAPSAE